MKRTGYIYDKITDPKNIKQAILNASKGKRQHNGVRRVLGNIDKYAEKISVLLQTKSYKPSPYITSTIVDGSAQKEREICKPKFYPDQIIHWALMQQLQPVIQPGMYYYSCGSIPGKGTSFGQKAIKRWMGDTKHTKYCLKMDIRKFYPSIPNDKLKQSFRRKVKDSDVLWLVDQIIDTAEGLPIGNYTSQWFANYYLTELDHKIKERGAIYYMRYVDDLVIFGSSKRKLHKFKDWLDLETAELGLVIKDNWQVFRTDSRPVDFLGLRFYRDHATLRRRNCLRIKRRAKKTSRKPTIPLKDAQAMISYWGWIKRSDSYRYYQECIRPYVKIKNCRKVVSDYAKANCACSST